MTQTGATDGAQAQDEIDLDDLREWGKADPGADDVPDIPAAWQPRKARRWRKWWAGSLIALLLIQQILFILVRTIPLEPDHHKLVNWVVFIVAGVATAGWIFGNRNPFDLSPLWRWLVAVVTGIPFAFAVLIVTILAMERSSNFSTSRPV